MALPKQQTAIFLENAKRCRIWMVRLSGISKRESHERACIGEIVEEKALQTQSFTCLSSYL